MCTITCQSIRDSLTCPCPVTYGSMLSAGSEWSATNNDPAMQLITLPRILCDCHTYIVRVTDRLTDAKNIFNAAVEAKVWPRELHHWRSVRWAVDYRRQYSTYLDSNDRSSNADSYACWLNKQVFHGIETILHHTHTMPATSRHIRFSTTVHARYSWGRHS